MASGMGWGGGCTEQESPRWEERRLEAGRVAGVLLGARLSGAQLPPTHENFPSRCWYPGQPQVEAEEVRRGGRRWDRYVSCEGPLSRAPGLAPPPPGFGILRAVSVAR